MKPRNRIIITSILILILVLCVKDLAFAYGYNFVFPSARRSTVSGYTYADPDNPTHLAWDYRFSMHTKVAAAQKGWVATSRWDFADGHESTCTGEYDDRGNFVVLNHTSNDLTENTGLESWYFHLSNTGNRPASGTYLNLGQYMAYSGDTGCGSAHLHLATKNNGIAFDPYAGSLTNWVSGKPLPMGFRDQNNNPQGPFPLDNAKIRDKWLALEGAPGAPIDNDWSDSCLALNTTTATRYFQEFERGYIEYCGSASAQFIPYSYTPVYNVHGRYTCGAGENSFLVIRNPNSTSAVVSVVFFENNGTVRDSRTHKSLAANATWTVNVHDIVFDWLIMGNNTGGIFTGYAYVYSDLGLNVNQYYTTDADCKFIPAIMNAYPPP